jgi:AcrR family transcriptional regulator
LRREENEIYPLKKKDTMQEARSRNASRKQTLAKRKARRYSRSKSAPAGSSAPPGTREKLLDAAELLFADRGYNGVSTREIAAAAKANLGSIPYYFRSKGNLLKEVVRRRALPELEDRAVGVRRVLEAAGEGIPDVVAILKADLDPVFHRRRENIIYRRLAGRLSTDPNKEVRRIVDEIYNRKALIFDIALRRACPHLSDEEFYWRFYCLFGAVQYVLADVGKIQTLAGRIFNSSNPDIALKYVVPFLAAGLTAPPTASQGAPSKLTGRGQSVASSTRLHRTPV